MRQGDWFPCPKCGERVDVYNHDIAQWWTTHLIECGIATLDRSRGRSIVVCCCGLDLDTDHYFCWIDKHLCKHDWPKIVTTLELEAM